MELLYGKYTVRAQYNELVNGCKQLGHGFVGDDIEIWRIMGRLAVVNLQTLKFRINKTMNDSVCVYLEYRLKEVKSRKSHELFHL